MKQPAVHLQGVSSDWVERTCSLKKKCLHFSFCIWLKSLGLVQAKLCAGDLGVAGGGLVTKSCLTLVTPRTVAQQAPLSMGFPKQEIWSGLPFPSPGNLPTQGSNPGLLHCRQSPALQADFYQLSHQGTLAGSVVDCIWRALGTPLGDLRGLAWSERCSLVVGVQIPSISLTLFSPEFQVPRAFWGLFVAVVS